MLSTERTPSPHLKFWRIGDVVYYQVTEGAWVRAVVVGVYDNRKYKLFIPEANVYSVESTIDSVSVEDIKAWPLSQPSRLKIESTSSADYLPEMKARISDPSVEKNRKESTSVFSEANSEKEKETSFLKKQSDHREGALPPIIHQKTSNSAISGSYLEVNLNGEPKCDTSTTPNSGGVPAGINEKLFDEGKVEQESRSASSYSTKCSPNIRSIELSGISPFDKETPKDVKLSPYREIALNLEHPYDMAITSISGGVQSRPINKKQENMELQLESLSSNGTNPSTRSRDIEFPLVSRSKKEWPIKLVNYPEPSSPAASEPKSPASLVISLATIDSRPKLMRSKSSPLKPKNNWLSSKYMLSLRDLKSVPEKNVFAGKEELTCDKELVATLEEDLVSNVLTESDLNISNDFAVPLSPPLSTPSSPNIEPGSNGETQSIALTETKLGSPTSKSLNEKNTTSSKCEYDERVVQVDILPDVKHRAGSYVKLADGVKHLSRLEGCSSRSTTKSFPAGLRSARSYSYSTETSKKSEQKVSSTLSTYTTTTINDWNKDLSTVDIFNTKLTNEISRDHAYLKPSWKRQPRKRKQRSKRAKRRRLSRRSGGPAYLDDPIHKVKPNPFLRPEYARSTFSYFDGRNSCQPAFSEIARSERL